MHAYAQQKEIRDYNFLSTKVKCKLQNAILLAGRESTYCQRRQSAATNPEEGGLLAEISEI